MFENETLKYYGRYFTDFTEEAFEKYIRGVEGIFIETL